VISLFLIGAGMLVYRQLYSEPATGEEIELKDGDIVPRSPGALARRFAPPPEGVRYNRNKDSATVRAGDVEMRVTLPAPTHQPTEINLYYARNYLSKDQSDLLAARARLISDAATAKYIGLTKEQRKALKDVAWPNMQPSDADRERMKKLWLAYSGARNDPAQSTAEDALVDGLKAIGDENLEKTKQVAAQRCDQIAAILSAEQIEKFKSMGRAQPAAAKKDNLAKVDEKR
jgi:hypothetical protein